jgi:hypothetical protein
MERNRGYSFWKIPVEELSEVGRLHIDPSVRSVATFFRSSHNEAGRVKYVHFENLQTLAA